MGIGSYTERQWGLAQRNRYLKKLEKRIQLLANNPHLGLRRDDVAVDYFSLPYGKHVIFYLIRKSGIDIIGILHQEMDILNYFYTTDSD